MKQRSAFTFAFAFMFTFVFVCVSSLTSVNHLPVGVFLKFIRSRVMKLGTQLCQDMITCLQGPFCDIGLLVMVY